MIKFQLMADQVEARFRELGSDSPITRGAVDAFARVLRTRIQLCFRSARSPSGAPWKPLNPLFRVGQPLRNTGRLYGSIQARRVGNAVLVGTGLKTPEEDHNLGAIHQFGALVEPRSEAGFLGPIRNVAGGMVFLKSAVIPARPFMPLDAAGNVNLPPAWARSALQAMARALDRTP